MNNIFSRTLSSSARKGRTVDYSTIIGVISAFSLVFIAISLGGGLESFLDLKSFLIVIGGTVGATLVNFPLEDFRNSFSVLKTAFQPNSTSEHLRIKKLLNLARRKRKEGVLVFQNDIHREPDRFLKKAMELVIDELPSEEIQQILEIELAFLLDRHRKGAQLFQTMGAISPAMGLIGTLIGLVQMLQNLNDPSQIGPAMAIALLTTFYGALFANLIFLPLAGKLRARSAEEALQKEMTIEGIVGIVDDVNPRIIEQRLLSFLSPEKRSSEYE